MTRSKAKRSERVRDLACAALEDMKARDVVCCDVRKLTTVTDFMVVASGTSRRHLRALSDSVVEQLTVAGHRPLGTEGDDQTGWFLVDAGDVVVHVMSEESRKFYDLERLWLVSRPGQ